MKFRYAEGLICKSCYETVTANCATTVRQMSREELMAAYEARRAALEDAPEFRVTRRVGDFLLIDEERRLICLPNNRRQVGGSVSRAGAPEFIPWKGIRTVSLVTDPKLSVEALKKFASEKGDTVLRRMEISIAARDRREPYTIPFFTTPVRAKSFAFRQSLGMALRSLELLQQVESWARRRKET